MEVNVEKLKELREDRAYSQRELAQIAGVSHQTIHRLESGHNHAIPRTVRRLAEALGVAPRELTRGS
jgi:transcriptional regulator with XRE-family HTH domain